MRPQEQKQRFIQLRAEGKSYTTIAQELGISKSTCTAWNRELSDEIASLKREELEQLYNNFYMTKEARIKQLGGTLDKINKALDKVDLSEVPADKLLKMKLDYTSALKEEFIGTAEPYPLQDNFTPKDIVKAMNDLLSRVRAGEITEEQARKESTILTDLLKVYDIVEIKDKLDTLTEVIGGRS